MTRLLTQTTQTPLPKGFQGLGPLGNEGAAAAFDIVSASTLFEKVISIAIGVMTVIGSIWFIFQLISGAIQWLSAGGDKQAVQNAQKKISTSVVGIFLIATSLLLIITIGNIVGLNFITYPSTLIINYLHP